MSEKKGLLALTVQFSRDELAVRFLEANGNYRPDGMSATDAVASCLDRELAEYALILADIAAVYFCERLDAMAAEHPEFIASEVFGPGVRH